MEFFIPGIVQAESINRLHKGLQEFISAESIYLTEGKQDISRYLPNPCGLGKKNQDSALCFKDIYSRITISFYLCKLYKEENIIESLDHFYATDQVNWYKITMFH